MKRLLSITLALALLLSLTGCLLQPDSSTTPTATVPTTEPGTTTNPGPLMDNTGKYYLDETTSEAIVGDCGTVTTANDGNARVYYQIFVGSFSDSNGDGIGDLRGIINRMDYLNDGDDTNGMSLGVEGIWLSPIFTSPSYHKYDCSDYYEIDPKFGTMEDLKELVDLCHQRGVQIILDLVVNHTATNHPWFKEFKSAHQNFDVDSKYYNFYSFSDTAETGYHDLGTGKYYEGHFSGEMPELNYDNPDVRQAMVDVAKYYLDLGVDGFRFDAAKYIYYGDEPRNAEFWIWYMQELRNIKPDIYTVAEVWDGDAATYPYFASTNCFNFSMSQVSGRVAEAAKGSNVNAYVNYIANYLQQIRAQKADAMLCSFITNHDMDRAAGFLTTGSGHAQMAANLSILTPGSPFIYYGEEIGMLGSRGGANTDANRRLAMLWGDGDTVKNPTGSTYKAAQANGTVAEQIAKGDSLYTHYKRLIQIRKANPEIAYGEFTPLQLPGKTGGFLSTWNGKTVAVIHNTTTDAVTIDLSAIEGVSFDTLATIAGLGGAKLEGTQLTIDAQTSVVLR